MIELLLALIADEEDRNRIEHIYNKFSGLLLKEALSILCDENDADDALHDTFLDLIGRPHIFSKTDDDVYPYLFVVIKTKSLDIIRKKKFEPIPMDLSESYTLLSDDDVEKNVTANELRDVLLREIHSLSSIERDIMYLYLLSGGISFKEMAQTLGLEYHTVRNRFKSASTVLIKAIKEYRENE